MGIFAKTQSSLSLEHHMERLALEADVLPDVIQIFRETIPNFFRDLKERVGVVNEDQEMSDKVQAIAKEYNTLSKKLPSVPFTAYRSVLISVPEGFSGSFLEYTKFLTDHAQDLYVTANKILNEYHSTLAVFLSNSNSPVGLSDYTNIYRDVKKAREELVEKFKHFFPKDTGLSKQQLGSVIDRFADLQKLVTETAQLERVVQKQSMVSFKASVDSCVELLELVIKRTEEHSLDKISGPAAKNIAEGAYELGRFVELVALYRFRVQQFICAVDNTVTELNAKIA